MQSLLKFQQWEFPSGPVVRTPSTSTAGGAGLIHGQGTKIPHAAQHGKYIHTHIRTYIKKKKFPTVFFLHKADPQIHMELQGAPKSQNSLEKEQSWELKLLIFNTYCKATEIKIVWY